MAERALWEREVARSNRVTPTIIWQLILMSKTETAKILFKGLITPSDWTDPAPAKELRLELEKYFGTKVFPINSGQSAFNVTER